jgi:hypothetical protein
VAKGRAGVRVLVLVMVLATAPGFVPSGHAQSRPLPPGHPPVGGGGSPIPGPPPGSGKGDQGLTWTMPASWTRETPSSPMRRAQYRIPGHGGPGECVVFYFGPGQGGSAKANAARWAGQFRRPDGGPIGDDYKVQETKVGGLGVVLVEVAGTYVGGMGGGPVGPPRPEYMLLGAIADGPDAKWFFRATGPRATLEAQRAAFDRMIRSLRRGVSSS